MKKFCKIIAGIVMALSFYGCCQQAKARAAAAESSNYELKYTEQSNGVVGGVYIFKDKENGIICYIINRGISCLKMQGEAKVN